MPATPERIRERHAKWLADKRRKWDERHALLTAFVTLAYDDAAKAVANAKHYAVCGTPLRGGHYLRYGPIPNILTFGNHNLGPRP